MRHKALKQKANQIINENKSMTLKIFIISSIIMSTLFILISPIIKQIIDIILTKLELHHGAYANYEGTLRILTVGTTIFTVSIMSDFILIPFSLNLIQDKEFNLQTIKNNLKKIPKYITSKLINFIILFIWYVIMNILRIFLSLWMFFGIFGVFASISESSVPLISIPLIIFLSIGLIIFIYMISLIVYSQTFVLSFIALDEENHCSVKDIFKVYRKVMKKNKFKCFKTIIRLTFIPIVFIICVYIAYNDMLNNAWVFILGVFVITIWYPRIMIYLALMYERMYNYSEEYY